MKHPVSFLLPLIPLFLCAACGQEERARGQEEGARHDRAEAALLDVPRLVVDSVQEVTIGLSPPDDRYVFSGILEGGIIGDSLIVVVDDILKRVAIFGMDGDFLRRVITAGEGPAEVQSMHGAGILPNGWIWVYDFAGRKLLGVDHRGEVVSEQTLPLTDPMDIYRIEVIGLSEDGAWWLRREEPGPDREPGEFFRLPTSIQRLGPDGSMSTVWTGEGDLVVSGGTLIRSASEEGETGLMRSRDLTHLVLTPYRDGVLFAWSDSSSVEQLHPDGTRTTVGHLPVRRVRAPDRPLPRDVPIPRAVRALRERPRFLPEIHALRVSPSGDVWAVRPSVEEDAPALRYRISGRMPTAMLSSPGVHRLATPTANGWILARRTSPVTREAYVALHRVRPARE